MTRKPVLAFNPCRRRGTSAAIIVLFLAISLDAARAECVPSENNMALARVITGEAKLYFVSGPRKQPPQCPSAATACRIKAYLVPGDEILINVAGDPYLCARFKSQSLIETIDYLPRAALELVPSEHPSIEKWDGRWRRDPEAEIVLKSGADEVTVSGNATWGGSDPERVKRGAVHVGELEGTGRPRGRVLAIGYDPDRSAFPPDGGAAEDGCAAKLELYGRYLIVGDNGRCGGVNVSFNGVYVR
jgi:hypothetical protein